MTELETQTLGQRIVEAARLAVAMHLASLADEANSQTDQGLTEATMTRADAGGAGGERVHGWTGRLSEPLSLEDARRGRVSHDRRGGRAA